MEVRYINAFHGLDISERRIPIMILRGKVDGPKVWLVAACHGNEVTGIEVIHHIFDSFRDLTLSRGILYAMPLMNVVGTELMQRKVPIDSNNLNNNYPGNDSGSFTERIAKKIFDEITETQPRLVIDLHTISHYSIPFIILDRYVGKRSDINALERANELAEIFGITVLHDFPLEEYKKQNLHKSLPGALINHANIPAFTIELGPTGIISEFFKEIGVHGIYNVLAYLGMTDITKQFNSDPMKIQTPYPIHRAPELLASNTGIVQYLIQPGEQVSKGQDIARIKNILGDVVETITSQQSGYVIAMADKAIVFPGMPLITIAVTE